jgi:hypothetical protein
VRRRAASCRAVLRSCPSHHGGRCRHRRAVMGAERRRRGNPSEDGPPSRRLPSSWPSRMSGRLPRRSSLCPRPLSAMRTSVHLVGRTSGVQSDRRPGVRCDPGVRTDTRPVSAASAAALSAPRWIRNTSVRWDRLRLAHRVGRIAVVGERLGRRCPNRPGGRDGHALAVRGSHECRRQTWAAAWHACRLRRRARRLADNGSWSSARCWSVGGGQGRSRCSQVPRRCVLGGLPA